MRPFVPRSLKNGLSRSNAPLTLKVRTCPVGSSEASWWGSVSPAVEMPEAASMPATAPVETTTARAKTWRFSMAPPAIDRRPGTPTAITVRPVLRLRHIASLAERRKGTAETDTTRNPVKMQLF